MRAATRVEKRLRPIGQPWEFGLFGFVPVVLLGVVFFSELRWGGSLGDFTIFRDASRAVLHGHSPYVAAEPRALAHNDKFVYPPITGLLFAPFAALPLEAARVLMLVAVALSIPLSLWLLGVRDWRCYGTAILTAPFVDALSIGALTPFLLVGASVSWRFRDRLLVVAVASAVTGVAKVFLWPIWLWLLATRRFWAAAMCAGTALVLLLAGWAVIGFAGIGSYPHLLRVLSDVEAGESYSLVGLLKLTGQEAALVTLVLSATIAGLIVVAARGDGGDRRAFATAVAGALFATPVLWIHYFVLLPVPIALFRPRLSAVWILPLALWVTPLAHSDGVAWRIIVALGVGAIVSAVAVGSSRRTRPSRTNLSRSTFVWLRP